MAFESDTGASNNDGITKAEVLSFNVNGTTAGATVNLVLGNQIVGTAIATETTTLIVTDQISNLGNGTYELIATQTLEGLLFNTSAPVSVTVDKIIPSAVVSGIDMPNSVYVGDQWRYDPFDPTSGESLRVRIESGPEGMKAVEDSGKTHLLWTPTLSELGVHSVTLTWIDIAGNERTGTYELHVVATPEANLDVQIIELPYTRYLQNPRSLCLAF